MLICHHHLLGSSASTRTGQFPVGVATGIACPCLSVFFNMTQTSKLKRCSLGRVLSWDALLWCAVDLLLNVTFT